MGLTVILRGNNPQDRMSALGQKQTSEEVWPMSALPPKADIGTQSWNVCFVPKADSCTAAKILSFALCPAQRPGGFDAVFPTLPHASIGPFPGQFARISWWSSFYGLPLRQRLQQREADDGDHGMEDS